MALVIDIHEAKTHDGRRREIAPDVDQQGDGAIETGPRLQEGEEGRQHRTADG